MCVEVLSARECLSQRLALQTRLVAPHDAYTLKTRDCIHAVTPAVRAQTLKPPSDHGSPWR
eukprot:931447-Pyramimonas_sp.AAC.1